MFLCVLTSFSWLMWVLHSRVLWVPVSQHIRDKLGFISRPRATGILCFSSRLMLFTASKAKPHPSTAVKRADSLFGLLLVHLKGKWNCSRWPVAAETLQFSWVYVRNWTVCPDRTTKQAHDDMPFSERTFRSVDVGLALPSFSLGDNKKKR